MPSLPNDTPAPQPDGSEAIDPSTVRRRRETVKQQAAQLNASIDRINAAADRQAPISPTPLPRERDDEQIRADFGQQFGENPAQYFDALLRAELENIRTAQRFRSEPPSRRSRAGRKRSVGEAELRKAVEEYEARNGTRDGVIDAVARRFSVHRTTAGRLMRQYDITPAPR